MGCPEINVHWWSKSDCQRDQGEAEQLLWRFSLRTRKLRRQKIRWIRVGILEETASEELEGVSIFLWSVLMETRELPLKFWSDFIAGCIGGSAGIVAGYPLDTIKVRQQTCQSYVLRPTILITASDAFAKEGPKVFFRGMAFPLLSEGFRSSLFFGIYGKILGTDQRLEQRSCASVAVAAGIAGGIQGVAATPIELVKVNLQSQNGSNLYSGPVDCLRKLYTNYGVRGIFKGLNVTILREVPALATYMTTYECLCQQMKRDRYSEPSLPAELLAGGLAGVLSWIVNIPVDLVKTRIQSDSLSSPRYCGIVDCFVKSCREEGFRVLFRGLAITCVRAFPTNAVTLVVYSKCLRVLQERSCGE